MAIRNDLDLSQRLKITDAWDGNTGTLVEDLISRHLVNSMEYIGTKLYLYNSNSEEIASTEVTVAEPIYTHTIAISGIYFNSTSSTNLLDGDTLPVCKLGTKIYLGVQYLFTNTSSISGNITNIGSTLKLEVNVGDGYVEIPSGIVSNADIQYIDITDYYTKTTTSKILLRATAAITGDAKIATATTTKLIEVVNPTISYSGDTYIVNGQVSFSIQNGGSSKYSIYYKIGNANSYSITTDKTLSLTDSGLVKVLVYAQSSNNSAVKSDTLTINVINVLNGETFNSPLCVVNEITNSLNNWEFSKLYKLSVYYKSLNIESIDVNTSLTSTGDSLDKYLNKTKTISLVNESGYTEMDISYFLGLSVSVEQFTAALYVNAAGVELFDEGEITIDINNSGSYSYTPNAVYSFDLYSPDESNIFTKDIISNMISPDGLITEDSLSVVRLSAGNYPNNIVDLDLSSCLTSLGFTFEIDFKTFNISDETLPLLKLGRFILNGNEFNWQYGLVDESLVDTTARSSIFRTDTRTHLLVEVVPNFKAPTREIPAEVQSIASKTTNLVRVFINSGIDREYKYSYLTDFNYNGFSLQINPQAADIDIYGMRVYNRALTLNEVLANYTSTISTIEEKDAFVKANDILATDSNNDTYVSYKKVKELYNTLVYIMPKGKSYPNLFNIVKGVSIKGCTVFINYVNSEFTDTDHVLTEALLNRCSGRFTNAALSGQGTSAMKYYWFNIQMKKPTFTSLGCYDEEVGDYVKLEENPNNYLFESSKYYMPEDTNCEIGINKLCGKFNYASSMQSHKIGAVKAFHDLWDACVDKSDFSVDEIKGRKACLEDAFIVFYVESDLDEEALKTYKLSDLNALADEDIKFAGFLTWGSAKGDKNTFGYNDSTPGYILLEGAENDGTLCNWLAPWSPDCIELSGETFKTKVLSLTDGTYGIADSFDVDFGLDDNDTSGSTLSEDANETMQTFIKAYNFAYMHTINLLPYTKTYALNDSLNTNLDITKKYYITNILYKDEKYFSGTSLWDVFRYDTYSLLWVPAGLPKLDSDGNQIAHETALSAKNTTVFLYETFNLKAFHKELGTSGSENISTFISDLKSDFKAHFNEYFHAQDIIYHLAFVRLFAGTDNRAKNTYFKLFSKDSRILMLLDDLDTILATDNRGLLKKPYYLLEPSLEDSDENKQMWGGSSAFFELVDAVYKEEIDAMLKSMLLQMNFNNTVDSLDTWMTLYFYYVLKYYPSVAYNYTARLAYEDALIFFDNANTAGILWTNNGLSPLSLAHGSCLESEIAFMRKRLIMFISLALLAMFGREGSGIPIKVKEDSLDVSTYEVKITPYLYMYLGYLKGSNPMLYSKDRATAGLEYTVTIDIPQGTPSYYVLGGDYISKFDNFKDVSYNLGEYTLNAPKLLEFSANTGKDSVSPAFLPPSLVLNTNVLKKLDLTNVASLTSIDLSSEHTPKLEEIILTGTHISSITLPTGARLTKVYYPATLTNLTIRDNEGLQDVLFESTLNLETVYLNCNKVGNLDITTLLNNLVNSPNLKNVTLNNLNNNVSTQALGKLLAIGAKLQGSISLTDDNTTLADLSYETKVELVDMYGNIDDPSNSLYIQYNSVLAYELTAEAEVSIYGKGYSGNPFNVHLDGNNFSIIKENDKYYPDITYTFDKAVSSQVATINKRTGIITMNVDSSATSVAVTISIKLQSGSSLSTKVTVNFSWIAPKLGDFMYADGTYSSAYLKNKTLIGIIYRVFSDDSGGTAYILGKDRGSSLLVGYSDEAKDTTGTRGNLLRVKEIIEGLVSATNYLYVADVEGTTDSTTSTIVQAGAITPSTYKDTVQSSYRGKQDTKAYIDHVATLLSVLKRDSNFSQYISSDNYITSRSNLDNVLDKLYSYKNVALSEMHTLVFPYFYEVYLYEPDATDIEKATDAFLTYFSKGNWYVPSIAELYTIIYLKGCSSKSYTTGSACNDAIDTTKTSDTAIFSKAHSKGAEFWHNIIGEGNLCTTTNASCNYTYLTVENFSGSTSYYTYKWLVGKIYDNDWGSGDAHASANGSRLYAHIPLQCVQFKFTKP